MSIFQCEGCGCAENTALASTYCWYRPDRFDWTGKEELKGKRLCSACLPSKRVNGSSTKFGKWHGEFTQRFLPLGEFETDGQGNLRHIKTGVDLSDWSEHSHKITTPSKEV